MKYLILGKNGQLGKAFLNALQNEDILGLDKEDCDISDFDILKEVLVFSWSASFIVLFLSLSL